MNRTSYASKAEDARAFLAEHGYVLANAARVHANSMNEEAAKLEAYTDSLTHNPGRPTPERVAELDASHSLFTFSGYVHTARLFRESALKSLTAVEALEALEDRFDEE